MYKVIYHPLVQKSISNKLLILSLIHLSVFLILAFFPNLFAGKEMDLENILQRPFQDNHHPLGTDQLGRDILSGIIYGCRTAVLVSLPSMLLATMIGVFLGSIAGYLGDDKIKYSFATVFAGFIFLSLGLFYSFYLRQYQIAVAFERNAFSGLFALTKSLIIFAGICALGYVVKKNILIFSFFKKRIRFPADQIILKLIELLSSIPRLILIICLASFVKPSIIILILLIGFTYWIEIARLTRGELLKIKSLHYIEAGRALGLTDFRLLFRHALPNALPAILVAFTFGVANLLALESTLSFLGIGLPPDYISWGRMIAGIRFNLSAWWLAVFPGIYLCFTVLALQTCSNYLIKKFNPKL